MASGSIQQPDKRGGRYLVCSSDSGVRVWIALEVDGQLFCYLPASGRFHFNRGLTADWLWDRELEYQPITVDQVRTLVTEGRVGTLEQEFQSDALAHLRAAPSLTDEEVDSVLSVP